MKTDLIQDRAPAKCPVALLLIDVINDLEWPGGDRPSSPAAAAGLGH